MNKEKVLAIEYPIITCYPWHACPLSILSTQKKYLPWILSNYIQLCGYSYISNVSHIAGYWMDFMIFDYEYSDIIPFFRPFSQRFYKSTFDFFNSSSSMSIIDFIIDNITKDNYIIMHLDEYYIPETEFYRKYNVHHQRTIYGFNPVDKTFYTCGFNKAHKFGFSKISFSQLLEAYNNSDDNFFIKLLKLNKEEKCDIDINFIRNILEDYLLSRNSTSKLSIYTQPQIKYNGFNFGMSLYDNLIIYINNIVNINVPNIDNRPFYLLWEHKKYMIELCKYLSHINLIGNIDNIVTEYTKIARTCLVLLNKVLKFQITHQFNILKDFKLIIENLAVTEKTIIKEILGSIKNMIYD